MKLHWFGASTFSLEIGDFKLLTNPFISTERAVQAAEHAAEPDLMQLDAVLVSCMRAGPSELDAVKRLKNDLRILAPALQAVLFSELGFTCVSGLGWWQVFAPRKGHATLHIQATPAVQPSGENTDLGQNAVNGYLISHTSPDGEWKAYWTGETDWNAGIEEVRQRVGILDLLILNLEENRRSAAFRGNSFSIEAAARMIRLFEPRMVIPIQLTGSPRFADAVAQLKRDLAPSHLAERIAVLAEGQSISVNGAPA
jgi:L-ascorbate metabolism protein UlaG (beta-lactamase superfamily)